MDNSSGVILVRHGHTALNSTDPKKDLIRGWRNVPLDERGKKETKETAAWVSRQFHPVKVYCSDLDRATILGRDLAKQSGAPLRTTPDLRPWGLGKYQGQPAEKVVPELQHYIDHPSIVVPGGGESFNSFRSRVIRTVKKAMEEHLTTGENVAVCTHFRDMKLIQAWLAHPKGDKAEEIHAETFAANDIPTSGVLILHRERGRWKAKVQTNPKVGVKRTDPQRAVS